MSLFKGNSYENHLQRTVISHGKHSCFNIAASKSCNNTETIRMQRKREFQDFVHDDLLGQIRMIDKLN